MANDVRKHKKRRWEIQDALDLWVKKSCGGMKVFKVKWESKENVLRTDQGVKRLKLGKITRWLRKTKTAVSGARAQAFEGLYLYQFLCTKKGENLYVSLLRERKERQEIWISGVQ